MTASAASPSPTHLPRSSQSTPDSQKVKDLELQNATLELGQQKLLKQIAQLASENEELKRSAEERKKLRSGEAKLNTMHSEAKELANGYDADGFPIPPQRPKALSENVVPSPQVVTGTSLMFAETPPTNGQHRKSAPVRAWLSAVVMLNALRPGKKDPTSRGSRSLFFSLQRSLQKFLYL